MEDRYDISVDIGEEKDYSVATLFENGEYRPIAVCDTISFGSDVEHSGYVGVEAGELSFSAEIVDGEDNIAEKNAFQQARDIMKWLREEQSPHTLMIIDGYHVELLDGVKAEVWKE